MRLRNVLAAVRNRLRRRGDAPTTADAVEEVRAGATPPVAPPARPAEDSFELERLAAEARYHRDRFELYRARVISGSSSPTTPARLRELERAATAAEDRLAHARRGRSPG